ncbi:MAG TPA: copper-translocating P-type ATPase [Ignavibacteriales bacterium]|nr:copper-translocating P-type ATPase [Ignavibacteriales bacterium]
MDHSHEKHTKYTHESHNGHRPHHMDQVSEIKEHSRMEMEHASHAEEHKGYAEGHEGHAGHEGMIEDFKRRFWISLVLTIPVLVLSPMIQHFLDLGNSLRFSGDIYLLFVLSSVIYFYGGFPFLKGIYEELRIKRMPGMMTLIAVAISTAYVYSSVVAFGLRGEVFFWELATLIDIMLVGHWIEMRSVMSASRALEELAKLLPSEAHKLMDDGTLKDVELEELKVNDKILIKPGEKVPADGDIIEGKTFINESMLTGEARPVSKEAGGEVIGGSINGEGSVTVKIKRMGKDSFLSQVIELVQEAQQSKSRTQNLADRAAFILTVAAILGGVITFFLWNFLASSDTAFALERTVTVMVIACPHALGLAVPLVVAVSTSIAAGNGFLIRDRTAFESARKVTAIVFDKTGTLTEGNFGVTDVVNFSNSFRDDEILKYAASVEANSQHPIAKGIAESAKETYKVQDFNSITGKGIEGTVEGKSVRVVSPGYLSEKKIAYDEGKIEKLQSQGKTVVFVLIDNKLTGAIALGDRIRSESKEAIGKLRSMGVKSYMLTGDNAQTAKFVSDELELDSFIAEVLPDQKSGKIKEIQKEGYTVAMTGDGVNDAPALAQADVGIAIGAGSDVAVETADVILIKNNPNDVAAVIELSRSTYKKMIQNLWWAAGYNIVAIPLAAGVLYKMGILLSPALGAVLMSASTVIVAINARLLKINKSY